MSLLAAYQLRGKLKTEGPSEWDMILPRPPRWGKQNNAAVRFRGRHRKTTFGENGKEKADVHGDSEHRIVTPQSKSAALRSADFTQGHAPEYPY